MKWFIKYGISASIYLLIAYLFISQPDFGMTLILTITWLTQLFVYGLSLIFIFIVLIMVFIAMIFAYKTLPHVTVRINDFLDTSFKDYQIERSLDSYINGGFFGLGPGNGFIKKFIPDAHTDFIFAVISEEFGLIFSVAIIILFLTVITKVIKNINQEGNIFNYITLTGLISLFTLQFIVNVGVSLAILPTKGMTLPFISYGGSSMISMSICFGVILSLTKKKYQTNKLKYFY
jgi:cell division protein FtsW